MSASESALQRILDTLAATDHYAIQDVHDEFNGRSYNWTMYAGPRGPLTVNVVRDTDTGEVIVFDLWRPATGSPLVDDDLAFIRGERP